MYSARKETKEKEKGGMGEKNKWKNPFYRKEEIKGRIAGEERGERKRR